MLIHCFIISEISLEIHQSIFQCFYSISDNCDSESLQYLYDKVVPAMYHWIITHCHVIGWRDIVRDETVLQHVAAFLRKTITKLSRQDERYCKIKICCNYSPALKKWGLYWICPVLPAFCGCVILWFCHSVIIQMKLEYLWGQLASLDQILYEASIGWGKGWIRFWDRMDQNSGFHGNRKPPMT